MRAGTARAQDPAGRAREAPSEGNGSSAGRDAGAHPAVRAAEIFVFRRPFSSRPGSSEAAREASFTCSLWDGAVSIVLRAGPLFLPKISWNVAAAAAASRQFSFLFPLRGKKAVLLF